MAVIGGWDNTRSVIRRQQGARNIADIPNASFLSKNKFIQFVIQITTSEYDILTVDHVLYKLMCDFQLVTLDCSAKMALNHSN